MKRMILTLLALAIAPLLLALPASAADGKPAAKPAGFEIHRDGSLVVDGEHYGSMLAFQASERFRAEGRRCATPELDEILVYFDDKSASDCTMSSTTIRSEFSPQNGSVYSIPVVFHVIQRSDGTGNISDSLIHSQIAILNEDFRASGGLGGNGTDAKIEFHLATTDPNGNATTGITRTTSNAYFTDPGPGAFNDMKDALNWDPTKYLNIYSNDAAGNLGYATFPQQDAGEYLDGVVLLYSSVGRNAPGGGIYDQGRTGTHEVGHYLGLFHTFQGGCGTASAPYTTGDLIADTPRQQSANFDCPAGATSCSSADPIENYMNYTQDTCMEKFSPEQINRMRCSIDAYRASLVGGGGGPGPGDDVLQNQIPVNSLSGSTGAEDRYTMSVPSGASNLVFQISGGTGDADLYVRHGSQPTTSTYDCRPYLNGNNETCSFPSPAAGTWHVMLRAYSSYSGVALVGSYSTAAPNNPPTANFTFTTSDLTATFSNTSSDSDGSIASRSWTFGDGGVSTSNSPSHTYASGGTYSVTLTVTDDDGATDSETKSVTVTAPVGGGPCSGCEEYSGSLSGTGDWDALPNGTYYQSAAGTHEGWLEGPSSADFDLALYKWSGGSWTKVSQSISSSSSEHIAYSGTSGYYYWRVTSYSGSGSYDFWLDRP